MKIKTWLAGMTLIVTALILPLQAGAQCETWINSPQKEQAENAHVLYRGFIKQKDYQAAYPYWKQAYTMAPAADGRRSSHFSDGIDIYRWMYQNTDDPKLKESYADTIVMLYEQWVQCYPNEKAYALGLEVYDLFYNLRRPYEEVYEIAKRAVEEAGDQTQYTVFVPYATVAVYLFSKEKLSKEETRAIYERLHAIGEYNKANNKDWAQYYEQAMAAMDAAYEPISQLVFDCEYFKNKYLPMYEADPDNPEVYKEVYKYLVQGGCDKNDPIVREIYVKDSIRVMQEYIEKNPAFAANILYQEGKYEEALAKYREAIEQETDPEKKAQYYFSMASIEFRKLKRYGAAREHARKAAALKDNWGQPYMLIGDMYAATSSSCGNEPWDHQIAVLAAIEKYAYAKAIDPSVAEEANSKIAKYRAFMPEKQEGFMRGVNEGAKVKVPCWIGETVTVRYK